MELKSLKKSDFTVRGRFTGSRLAGRENEFVYEIYLNGTLVTDIQFTSKAKASAWLGKLIKAYKVKKIKESEHA